jgi:hypothetical protein
MRNMAHLVKVLFGQFFCEFMVRFRKPITFKHTFLVFRININTSFGTNTLFSTD